MLSYTAGAAGELAAARAAAEAAAAAQAALEPVVLLPTAEVCYIN